jgi:alkylhydroperoxidase family enzyme
VTDRATDTPASPRVRPIPPEERSPELAALITPSAAAGSNGGNWFATALHNPELFQAWRPFARHLNAASSLPWRERELMVLRTAHLCRSEYEWGQHVLVGRNAGLTDDEIRRVRLGPSAPGWTAVEAALLQVPDELHESARVSDETWAELSSHYDTGQLIEVLLLVGQYFMLAFTLNSLGVEREDGIPGWEAPADTA